MRSLHFLFNIVNMTCCPFRARVRTFFLAKTIGLRSSASSGNEQKPLARTQLFTNVPCYLEKRRKTYLQQLQQANKECGPTETQREHGDWFATCAYGAGLYFLLPARSLLLASNSSYQRGNHRVAMAFVSLHGLLRSEPQYKQKVAAGGTRAG